ncbi:Pumilio y domain member 6 [Coemansia sp. 'formosensis']|nr:Pumilio y domain member 6 [Coemansia sp. 'formosensis']
MGPVRSKGNDNKKNAGGKKAGTDKKFSGGKGGGKKASGGGKVTKAPTKPYTKPTTKAPAARKEEVVVAGSRAQQQKKQRSDRQQQGAGGDVKIEARKLWEQLRRGDLDADVRATHMVAMMALIGGRIKEITLKHDMSRVVQTCIKYGTAEQRAVIAAELTGAELELARSMYGRHILLRLLKHVPASRPRIIAAISGQVRKLVRHKDAAAVVDECYSVYANAAQRWGLAAEFYGGECAVMGSHVTGVDAILAQAPQRRAGVVAALQQASQPLLEKGTVQHAVVHRVLLDLVRLAEGAERRAAIEALHTLAVEMVHTRDGAHCAMLCLLHGTPKDRKALVRSFRPFLRKMATDEHAHAVLIGALDCVDDTVFVAKTLVADLAAMADDLLPDTHGRRVLLYALAGRSPHYVGADALAVLRAGDDVRAATSKKDPATRRKELAAAVGPALVAWAERNAAGAVFESLPSQAVMETLVRAPCEKRDAWAQVLALVSHDVGPAHVLVHPVANRVVSTCILAGHAPARAATADAAPPFEGNPPYAADVLDALVASCQLVAAAKAGAFPVRALLEVPATADRTRKLLRPHAAELSAESNATTAAIVALLK